MTTASSAPRGQVYRAVRPGGRSERVRVAVLRATVEELVERGYENFSVQGTADRAGVHHSTLRRRWGDRPGLVLAALADLTDGMVPAPDEGSLAADLRALATSVSQMLDDPVVLRLLQAAFAMPAEQLDALRSRFWGDRFAVAQDVVDRAVVRGELPPGTVGWDVVEPVHATLWMRRLVTGLPVDDAVLERSVLLGLAAAGVTDR